MTTVTTIDELRALYGTPGPRAVHKERPGLDAHSRHFIALSPFLVLASGDASLALDASPRGGDPGFVRESADGALLIPDAPGNNRLDSLENIVRTGRVGLLFLIPGVNETLRINGRATLSTDAADIAACTTERRAPKLVIRVVPEAVYLHCAKAFMRSKLWQPEAQIERSRLPTMGQMLAEQTGLDLPVETQAEMERRYAADL